MTTVLLVEDEVEILKTEAELFRMRGFDVMAAATAEEARHLLDGSQHIDVVFSDIRLGSESGLELAYWVHLHHPDVCVVLTTGYSGSGNEIRWPLLMKPFLCEQAVKLINSVLEQRSAAPLE